MQGSEEDPEPVGSFMNVNQKKYAEDILRAFNMKDADSASTPIEIDILTREVIKADAIMSAYCIWLWWFMEYVK